jgi:hypothetical protein
MKKKKSTNKNSIYYEPSDVELRARGYMTTDEFVETLVPGLKQHMANSWHWAGDDALHHPSDLASTASMYTESVYNVIETFGVQPYNEKDK